MAATEATTAPMAQKPKKARNGLIDLYRFLLSLIVVKSHALFIVDVPYFSLGRACVEFFFVLSGYLLWSFLCKCRELSIKDGLIRLCKSRVLPLAIPLGVGIVSNIISSSLEGEFGIWGYLWYIKVLFGAMVVLFLLRKLVRSDRLFISIVMGVMAVALVLKFFGPYYSFSYARGASSIPMGIFIASLPKIKKKPIAMIGLIASITACALMLCFNWADVTWFGYFIPELILDNVLYPALIYFTFCFELKCAPLSYLGALSFGMYAFQCPADLFRKLGLTNVWLLFGFILAATLIEDGGKRLYRHIRKKRTESKTAA